MPTTETARAKSKRLRRIVGAAGVGTMMEFYDFAIFGTAAALVFGKLFFPSVSPVAGTLASFATFAAAFVARPIGGIIFGHFGDRIGRKRLLQISLIGMGLGTVLIGALPTYSQVGLFAPIALVVLRVVQGLAAGGEIGGAVVTVLEHAPRDRKATLGAFVFAFLSLGGVLAALTFLALSALLTSAQFESWGWRIPFLISIVLLGVGSYVRNRLEETPTFQKVAEDGGTVRIPLLEVMRRHWRSVLLVIGTAGAYSTATFLVVVYVINFLTNSAGVTRTFSLVAYFLSMSTCALVAIFAGRLADTYGRRRIMAAGLVGVLLGAFPFFAVLTLGSNALVLVAMIGMGAALGVLGGPLGTHFSEVFPPSIRYSGFSVGYQLASIVGGGIAPFVAATIYTAAGNQIWSVALYMAGTALIGLVCLNWLPDRGGPRAASKAAPPRKSVARAATPDSNEDPTFSRSH